MLPFPTLYPPTKRGFVSSTWGKDRSYRGGVHEGLDFPGLKGEPIRAAAEGIVAHVDLVDNSFAGKFVVIEHIGGVLSRYLHMNAVYVVPGQYIFSRQVIGELGDTGTRFANPHVHFDIKLKTKYLPTWIAMFGKPTTGLFGEKSGGVGIPAEPIMANATYSKSTRAFTEKLSVPFYHESMLDLLLGAAGLAGAVMVMRS